MITTSQSQTDDLAYLKFKVESSLLALYQNDPQAAISYLHSIQATLKLMESPEIDWNDTSLGEKR